MLLHDNLTDSPHIFVLSAQLSPRLGFLPEFLEASVYGLLHKRRLEKRWCIKSMLKSRLNFDKIEKCK